MVAKLEKGQFQFTVNGSLKRSMSFENTYALQQKSHALIPGGAHTYAKGDDQYPKLAPGFIAYGKGSHVWDVDGNEFIEYGMGLRSVTLGHAYPEVTDAAARQVQLGVNFTRPAPIEIECAEKLLDLIEGAEMVKFAKNGSDITTAAVKLARAHTGRDLVAICADHPFFSIDDWFIGVTAMSAGIPKAVRDFTVKFHFNDLDDLRQLFARYPEQIACVVLEAETAIPPDAHYLQGVLDLAHQHGALLILDEMITGFRWHNGGAQRVYGITPDLSAFGKAIGNGFSVSALCGRREIMELGGLKHNRERVFLLSTTHGAETPALAAALATMLVYENGPVIEHLDHQGRRLIQGIEQAVQAAGVPGYFEVLGKPCNLIFTTRDQQGERSQPFRTLFLQEMIARGVICPSLVVSYSHSDLDIDVTVQAVYESLQVYRRALDEGIEHFLVGDPVQPVFRKYC